MFTLKGQFIGTNCDYFKLRTELKTDISGLMNSYKVV